MIPTGRHTDWIFPFSLIPRSWTAWESDTPPRKLCGNAKTVKPIPDSGEWLLSWPLYFAFQTKGGIHGRIGIRWDDVDHYYQFPSFTLKRYN